MENGKLFSIFHFQFSISCYNFCMRNIFVKKVSEENIITELENIDFDRSYINTAQGKYQFRLYKIFNLRSSEASILKQLALSVGTDCAVNRNVITGKAERSDCVLGGSVRQMELIITKLRLQPFKLPKVADLLESQLKTTLTPLKIRNKTFDWANEKYIMGILNLTPDSFSDGGKYIEPENALKHAQELIEAGADILDIGAESTRPSFSSIAAEEEQQRLLPVLKKIRQADKNVIISIDTRNASTAAMAVDAGADIINDVSTGMHDGKMFETVAKMNVSYILTHAADIYECGNVVEEIYTGLLQNIENLTAAGVKRENIIADVGIGFGKTVEHNWELLKKIEEFTSLQVPLLVGHSRKSFLSAIAGDALDDATALISLYLSSKSTNIVRVHDVKKTKLALEIYKKLD